MKNITKQNINEAKQKSVWDFSNKILYDLCEKYPEHKKIDHILAKIMIIGRSYAAAIERRKKELQYNNDEFYIQKVGPTIKRGDIRGNVDQWIETLVEFKCPTFDNMEEILVVHGNLMNLFKYITGMEKRSLASKYLHFHKPALFFIFDSRAMKSIRKLVPPQNKTFIKSMNVDLEYTDYCIRCLKLRDEIKRKFNIHLSPRELDKLLLLY